MEQNNDTLGVEDVVFMLLETLKSNGTFDEIRRHCITDIDAKPTYQNWKQRIESNVKKFLSKQKYTPELNKNTVRERLRKHLLDGRETQDIEEGADRILTQVLAPRSLSIFEPKIAVAVDEYLGIKNEAPPIELNGLKESSMNLIKASNIEISTVRNPKIDFIPDAENIVCDKTLKGDGKDLRSDKKEKSSSLCKEPKTLNGNQSEDENDAGGSSKQKSSQHKNKTSTSDKSKSSSNNHKSSKKDNNCKEVVEKSKNLIEKSKDVINKPKDVVNKSKDVSKPNDIVDKSKDIVEKSKDIVNKLKDVSKSKDIVDKSKDIVNKPKDIVDKPKDIVEKSKDNVNKPKDIVDKSKEKSFLSKNSNSSSHKSNRTDRKRTKRSLEEKKKSSSLCKEPKLLNGHRSDDESNSGGSSKHKSTIHKNKSSSSDKTKSSSSNHKSSRRDNNSTDVVDKSKDKSLSKNSSSTDIVNKSKDKSLSKISNRIVDKSKDKYLSKNLSSTDFDRSKDKSLSKNSTSSDIDKIKKRSLSKNSSCIDIVEKSKNKSLSKNPSSTDVIDSSTIKSSLIKNTKCTDVVEKTKDKSLSKISSSSSHKSNHTDTKRLKLSQAVTNESLTNKVSDEEMKPKESEEPEKSEWNDFRNSIMTNDEQDAANVLLSMSAISYESSHSEIITENIIFIENSSPIIETFNTTKTVNELEIEENSDQMKILPSSDNDDIKENCQLKPNNLDASQSLNSMKSIPNIGHLLEKECSVDIERLPCKDLKLECSSVNSVDITEEHQKPDEIVVDEKEFKILIDEINLETSENEKTSEYTNSNDILKVPKLKLKLLPNQIDSINKIKRKKHHKHKESKKLKLSKSLDIPIEVSVSVSVSTNEMCDKIDQKSNNGIDVIMNDSASTLSNQILHKEIENNSVKVLDDDESLYTFKGFSEADAIPCKNYKLLKNVIKTLQIQMNKHDEIENGFKGFTNAETNPCKHRDNVYAELIKLKESKSNTGFIGFSKEDTAMSIGYKYVVKQLELAKKQNNVDNHQQNVICGGNGIQKGKTFNEVMAAYLYKSNNDNDAKSKGNYSKPINDTKKESPTVNNNNHNHDNWVAEQEMKYKLLPVKVKLERLMEYGCNNAKRVSGSPQVPI
ncbi:biorientation of chromosomes in cell division protein 1-like 1 [Acyrthosiphon pisum]|uniref:BOD1/SHG1 domain-containing protein n=1 Tax=Acyrthosiphon pisum TaxID=7029 RepID=A0A8R2NRZ7_ACYPI|nr:biorientation of chromosomes in cell division protein 1-like 1 [Acyrthosiphon pisum]XP_029344842.1 biorientation of chromosomes in cell division protein 1-like 1 [Acyrthosiphon pisum]|eukprot:XP_001946451.2 PREDICTED: biorientation of chromosomes in cell division protein 1-like 1 [Acyrthosiphon pisum]